MRGVGLARRRGGVLVGGGFAAGGGGLDGLGEHGGKVGEGEQEVVGVAEGMSLPFAAFGEGDEDPGAVGVVESDVGGEASAASGLFYDGGCGGGGVEDDPAEAYAGGFAGVVEAGDAAQAGGLDVDGLGGGGLLDGGCSEEVLEVAGHVGGRGVEAG